MRALRALAAAVFSLASVPAACGGQVAPAPQDGAMHRLAVADCARRARCEPAGFARKWASAVDCVADLQPSWTAMLGTPWVRDGAGFADRCSAALDADTCAYGLPAACRPDTGTQVPGGACLSGFDCADGYCKITAPIVAGEPPPIPCGVCVAYDRSRPAACPACRIGERCIDGACRPPAKLGESCASVSCESDLHCVDGFCRAPLGRSAPCEPERDLCERSVDKCDPLTRLCTARPVAGVGEPCGYRDGHYTACEATLWCSARGVCVARAAEGQPCDHVDGDVCRTGFYCVDRVCRRVTIDMCPGG